MVNRIVNKIKDIFEEKGLVYFCDIESGRIGANFSDSTLMFRVQENTVTCKNVFKGDIGQDGQVAVRDYLNRINRIVKEGHFEMDEDGTVQFRVCSDVSEEQDISEYRIVSMMVKVVGAERNFRDMMYQVAKGMLSPEAAFKEAMEEAMKQDD